MIYKKLFELSIVHDYYENQICPDFSIEATTECAKLLRGHRLILKNKVNGIVVIAPVDSDNKPWIEFAENLRFTFILKLKKQNFIDFTDIGWKPVDNAMYQYIFDKNNQKIEASDKEILESYWCYLKVPRGQNILAIVDIYNDFSMSKVSEYKISFNAKRQYWWYYLITDKVTNGDEFLIEDKKDSTRKKTIKFRRLNSTIAIKNADPIFSALNQQFPQSQQYIFKSYGKIACQETGIKNIQLLNKKNSESDPIVLIKHLPNPPNGDGFQVINALKNL